ncbi:AsmA family protein [Sphingomonas sp. ABOLH]|uniref:AsmA family protein n=1 Tax=Sphingomonas sp. ABOLH TaxID=1985881 RepID=UPI000F7E7F74|nr:AsmA family protein [Sphingomonas sp. ABOLH]RSV21025.1 AsmA family protein [Sphingomonas sp. ABOLH]
MARLSRTWRFNLGGLVGLLLLILLILAAFPWGVLRDRVSVKLAERFGSDVSIGTIERVEPLSFSPTLIVRDLRIAQPSWAGPGDLVRLRRIDFRFRVLPLLRGKFDLTALAIDGGRVAMVRSHDGRKNWAPDKRGGNGSASAITSLTVRDLVIDYRDAVQNRRFAVTVASDGQGFRASGDGAIDNRPVTVSLAGPTIAGDGAWPFTARVAGPTITVDAKGTMASPLDTRQMTVDLTARANDLKTLDALIEAGLFGTQPVKLTARVRHDDPTWVIERLSGTIGRSRLASANATVTKADERTGIDGRLHFATLSFDDLATDEGRAEAAAIERRIGPRVVPGTRINLAKMGELDGRLAIRVDRLLDMAGLRSLDTVLAIDHSRLTVAPLSVRLAQGKITGQVVVDQRGRTTPKTTFDLRLSDSRISTFAGGAPVDAPLRARVRLVGSGDTIRQAVGRSNGTIGFAAAGGVLPAKMASMLGADVARGVLTDDDAQARLRCLGLRLDVANGIGRIDPLLIDTSRAQTRGQGVVRLSDETLSIALTGTPKQRTLLHLDRPVRVTGRLQTPEVQIPPGVKSAGGILRMLGRAIKGDDTPRAGNADCGALVRRVLG